MIAVFIETAATPQGRPQYIIVAGSPSPVVFSRISDGGRKGLNRWVVAGNSTECIPADAVLVREPVAILLSSTDEAQVALGKVTNIATKAQAAFDKAPVTDLSVGNLDPYGAVASNSPVLDQWVRDERRTHSVVASTPKRPPVTIVTTPATNSARPVTPAATPGIMSFIPDRSVDKGYVHRKVLGGTVSDYDLLDAAIEEGENVLLYGPTGSAKTTVVKAHAAARGRRVAMISGSIALEPSQIFGRKVINEHGLLVFQRGIATEVAEEGGTIILDEINFISPKIITPMFTLLQSSQRHLTLLDNNGETIFAHPDLLIVGTMNPGYAGTLDLNAALRNRFKYQISWGYDDAVEKVLVPSKSLREMAYQMREKEGAEEIHTPTPTNALMEFLSIAKRFGLDAAIANFVARYADDEAPVVLKVLEMHRAGIEDDLGIAPKPVVETDEQPVSVEVDEDSLASLAGMSLSI